MLVGRLGVPIEIRPWRISAERLSARETGCAAHVLVLIQHNMCIHIHIIYIYTYVCIHTYMCVYICIPMYIYIYTHIHIYIYREREIYICIEREREIIPTYVVTYSYCQFRAAAAFPSASMTLWSSWSVPA